MEMIMSGEQGSETRALDIYYVTKKVIHLKKGENRFKVFSAPDNVDIKNKNDLAAAYMCNIKHKEYMVVEIPYTNERGKKDIIRVAVDSSDKRNVIDIIRGKTIEESTEYKVDFKSIENELNSKIKFLENEKIMYVKENEIKLSKLKELNYIKDKTIKDLNDIKSMKDFTIKELMIKNKNLESEVEMLNKKIKETFIEKLKKIIGW